MGILSGDGFTETDRQRLIDVQVKQASLSQKLVDHIDRNEAWHTDRAEECKELKESDASAHKRINELKNCIAKKESWFTGVRNTVGTLVAIILGGVAVIMTVIKTFKD